MLRFGYICLRMTDPLARLDPNIRLSRILLAIGLVMILGMVLYPFGYDQAAFAVAGEMISRLGAVPYRDFLDTKPPAIFYLYSLSGSLFGHHMWSIRVFDLIVQLAASAYLYRIVRRYSSEAVATYSVAIYLMLYAGTGYWMTAQAEGFSSVFSLLLLDTTLRVVEGRGRTTSAAVLAGIALLSLFLLKFTLVIGFAAVAYFIIVRRPRHGLRFVLIATGAFVAGIAIFLLTLDATGSLDWFWESIRWVSKYSAITPLFSGVTIAHQYNETFIGRLTTVCTAVAVALVLATVVGTLKQRKLDSVTQEAHDLHSLLGLTLAAQLLGILIERKLFNYHYDRVIFAVAPLAAASMPSLITFIGESWHRSRQAAGASGVAQRCAIIMGCSALAFYSPLFKFPSQTLQWASVYISGKDPQLDIQERTQEYFAADQQRVARYVRSRNARSIFVWGNDVGVYYFARMLPTTLCLTATPFRTEWTPQSWRDALLNQLMHQPSDFFVAEFGDAKDFITGSPDDSYEALTKWPALSDFVQSNYQPDTTIGHFYVYAHR